MEIDGSLARNIDFEVADFGVHEESCSYRSDFEILINFEKVSCEMLVLSPPTCLVSFLWFCCGVAVPVGQAAVSEEVAGSFCVPA